MQLDIRVVTDFGVGVRIGMGALWLRQRLGTRGRLDERCLLEVYSISHLIKMFLREKCGTRGTVKLG